MRLTALYLGIGIAAIAAGALWMARGTDQPARSVAGEPHPSVPSTAPAADVMTYLYDAPETASDVRYEYHWEILSAALKATEAKWGAYRMAPAALAMSEQRQTAELKAGTGRLTVMYLGTTEEFEKTLTPVKIPVDRDLGGYMLMLIRKEDQAKFSEVRTVDDLRKFKIGLGLGWVDVGILQNSKLDVVTGSNYDGLFQMLLNKRFDAFSRAAVEIGQEYDQRKAAMPEMQVESSFILYYPLPMYFWFSKTPEGQRLADRVHEGMMALYDSGEYMKIFNKYQREKITRLDLFHRRRIDIPNPNLNHLEVPWVETRLWFEFDKAPQ